MLLVVVSLDDIISCIVTVTSKSVLSTSTVSQSAI